MRPDSKIVELAVSKLTLAYAQILDSRQDLATHSEMKSLPIPKPPLGPLTGIPVIGIVEHIAGPAALSTLVSDGAMGITIEPPTGDPARRYLSHECFTTFHAGKMSIAMDLKKDPNYLKVLSEAFVIIDNRSKRARDEDAVLQTFLKDANKPHRVIYCYISGFPGEDEFRAGNDVTTQAAMGIATVNGPASGQPLKVGFPVLDFAAADWAVISIQSRLIQMLRGIPIADEVNKVVPIHVSLAGVAARFLCSQYLDAHAGKVIQQRTGNRDNFISVFSFFTTQDHTHIAIGTLTDISFKNFCEQVILRPDLAKNYPTNALRLQHNEFIHAEIQKVISTQHRSFWVKKLEAAGITHAEVNSVEEVAKKPFAKHLFAEAKDGTTMIARPDGRKPHLEAAPSLNQHGQTIPYLLAQAAQFEAKGSDISKAASPYDFSTSRIHLLSASGKSNKPKEDSEPVSTSKLRSRL